MGDVLRIERLAFGHDREANLVRDLLSDASAKPVLSLLAFENDEAVGHILFSSARLMSSCFGTSVSPAGTEQRQVNGRDGYCR